MILGNSIIFIYIMKKLYKTYQKQIYLDLFINLKIKLKKILIMKIFIYMINIEMIKIKIVSKNYIME